MDGSRAAKTHVKVLTVKAVRWSIITIFLLNMMISLAFALQSQASNRMLRKVVDTQQAALVQITANTKGLEYSVRRTCEAQNRAAQATNTVLDAIIAGVRAGAYSEQEARTRIKRYTAARVPIETCKK